MCTWLEALRYRGHGEEVHVVIMCLSTVSLFLKTIHIPHALAPVVSLAVAVVFSRCNEQCLNKEARLTLLVVPTTRSAQTGCVRVCIHVCFIYRACRLGHLEPKIPI